MNQGQYKEESIVFDKAEEIYKILKDKQYQQASAELQKLITILQANLPTQHHNRHTIISQCYLNKAICSLCQQNNQGIQEEVIQLLQTSIKYDNLNYWAYFNLFSIYYQSFNYILALDHLKCSLSCLYLIKAVLSKDFQGNSGQKDLGKAIGYCPNNTEAFLLRLLMYINQNKWKKALNQIQILEQQIGESTTLETLHQILVPYQSPQNSQTKSLFLYILQQSIKSIKELKRQIKQQKLIGNKQENNEEQYLIKLINDKMYEFNEIMGQVNQLGHVFGVFHFKSLYSIIVENKKIIALGNIVSNIGKSKEPTPHRVFPTSEQNNKVSMEYSSKVISNINSVHHQNNQSNINSTHHPNNQSLFDYSKSNIYASKTQFQGNLLSSLHPGKQSINLVPIQSTIKNNKKSTNLTPVDQNQESNLISKVQSMENKSLQRQVQIRAVQSQIRAVESQIHHVEEPTPQSPFYPVIKQRNFGFQDNDDDFLLDSGFDNKSFSPKQKKSSLLKKQSIEVNNESKRSKLSQKKVRIYPQKEHYKFIQFFFNEVQFKETKEKLTQIYCQIQVKGVMSKIQKFKSKRENPKFLGFKSKAEWNQSLGYIAIPQEPPTIQVKIMRAEKDKFFDTCLGKGQIEMTSAGLNKFPLYQGTKIMATMSITLILAEQCLNNSNKQSNISSSVHTDSVNSLKNSLN